MQARGFTLFAKENDSKLFLKKTEVSTYCFSSLLPAYGFILKKLHCTNWATCAYGVCLQHGVHSIRCTSLVDRSDIISHIWLLCFYFFFLSTFMCYLSDLNLP